MQAEGEQQNGAAAKRKRKGPSVKERLMRCQRTERERLTFGKVGSFIVIELLVCSAEWQYCISIVEGHGSWGPAWRQT